MTMQWDTKASGQMAGQGQILGAGVSKLSEIDEEIDNLGRAIERLMALAERLHGKLDVAMCPEYPEKSTAEAVPQRESPLGNRLQSLGLALNNRVNYLSTLADRIRL